MGVEAYDMFANMPGKLQNILRKPKFQLVDNRN